MPIYEYVCRKCNKTFEYMQRMSDPPKRKCEACGNQALERLISQTSFHLKGGGWYKDLYSSPKPGSASAGKSDGASGAASGSESGSSSGSESGSSSESGSGGGGDKASGGDKGSGPVKGNEKAGKKAGKGSR